MASRPGVAPLALRVARSGLVTSCATALAVSAHAIGGGGAPTSGVVLLLAVLTGWAGSPLVDRGTALPRMVTALGVTQVLQHGLMTMTPGAAHQHGAPVDPRAMLAGHALAVLFTAVVLVHADRAVLAAADAVTSALPRRPLVLPATAALLLPAIETSARTPALATWVRAPARRGPPA
ncbi:hypothetical protein [Actinokineospora pegani]|uniref:hypothetical protein n=1 Tax=Actinokineospora pegani TaxID=2654637 RepID=UPI0012EA9DEA|nr:hypothetical protein [Actinokineospora pegani]